MAEDAVQVKRVLLVAPRMEPRGTCEYTLNLARELKRCEVAVAVCCAPGPMLDALHEAEVPVSTFEHLERLGLHFGERKRFLKAVADFAPQLVHGQSFRVAGALALLGKGDGPPLVLTIHWVPPRPRALRRLSRRLAGIIATTQVVREAAVNQCGVDRGKVKVIRNGIDVERLDARDIPPILRSRAAVVGSLGPVEEMRGHELFVRAVSTLVRRGVSAQFVVAGQGEELPEIRKVLTQLGLDRYITLATDFSTYGDVLDALDVVVQSSLVNISGFSILESMGHGRPVIAFKTGTACEIVADGETGLLVAKGDVKALAGAMERLITNKEEARRMGEKARRRVGEQFNIRTVARETVDYYAGLLSA
ncbi:MAG: glycosyltransferase family 4 protein [Candidatus Brocadiae bacterium]|nr:glycosyltransferase family 4 protein [Candidatus Brocadiia bacterium]